MELHFVFLQSPEIAQLNAQSAAVAQCIINFDGAVVLFYDGGTAGL